MNKCLTNLGLSIILLFSYLVNTAQSNRYSYIYIEGDKETPFYVKMEGEMMPRLGKNYAIIPNLDAGPTNFEILFQQHKYPSQKFVINIPHYTPRGFALHKINDQQFALYDLASRSYIISGNKPEEDDISYLSAVTSREKENKVITDDEDALPDFPKEKDKNVIKDKELPRSNDKRFIDNIALYSTNDQDLSDIKEELPEFEESNKKPVKERNKKQNPYKAPASGIAAIIDEESESDVEEVSDKQPVLNEDKSYDGVPNYDCKDVMSIEDFEDFAIKVLERDDDDNKLKFIKKNIKRKCFTTEQVRILANNFDTQSGRFEIVKMLYAQTADQGNYRILSALFNTKYLKEKFEEIINP